MRATLLTLALLALLAPEPNRAGPPPKTDLNTATRAELEALPGVGPVFAKRILAMRARNGPFRCVEEIRSVPRLPEKTILRLLTLLTVSGDETRSDCAALESARRGRPPDAPARQ